MANIVEIGPTQNTIVDGRYSASSIPDGGSLAQSIEYVVFKNKDGITLGTGWQHITANESKGVNIINNSRINAGYDEISLADNESEVITGRVLRRRPDLVRMLEEQYGVYWSDEPAK